MATDEDVAAGLIDWINSLEVAKAVYTTDELSDGNVIWKVLHRIDRLSFPGKLPEPVESNDWVDRWTNLKHINDALHIFLIEECSKKLPLPSGAPDLKAIAQSSSLHDVTALLKLVVVAAINCSDRIKFLEPMQDLAESTQEVLMTTAQEAGEDDGEHIEENATPQDLDIARPAAGIDLDLASEERLGRVIADNQRIAHEKRELQQQLDDSYSRYTKLQERHARDQEELREANDRLTAVLAGRIEGQKKPFEAKHDAIIAGLEARAAAAENENTELRKSSEVLKIKAEKVQKLQDDYDEIKIERDRLSRKANTAEKYKQKLELTQELEKENQNLRDKVGDLQTQLHQSDTSRVSTSDLQIEVDEYRRLLPCLEQERHELNEMHKRLQFDYQTLQARYHDTIEELSKQQHTIEEFQGRLRDYEDGPIPSTPANGDIKGLALDENDFADNEDRLTAALLETGSEGEDSISEEELKAILAALRAQVQDGEADDRELSLKAQKRLLAAVEHNQSTNKRLLRHVQQQSELIKNLQNANTQGDTLPTKQKTPKTPSPTRSTIMPSPIASPAIQTRLEASLQLNENLRRELTLMTSAWYEQNRRLASTGVGTFRSRGTLEPRGFLGKQRKAIDSIALGGMIE